MLVRGLATSVGGKKERKNENEDKQGKKTEGKWCRVQGCLSLPRACRGVLVFVLGVVWCAHVRLDHLSELCFENMYS